MRPLRIFALMIGCAALTSGLRADEPIPPPKALKAPPQVVFSADAYRAATPYNATLVGRTVPNPQYNRPDFTLPCENCHQNFAPLVLERPECIKRIFGRTDAGCTGCAKHGKCGFGEGNCATCNNTYNFTFGGSRSFFGESSREFFERPVAVDGARHKWNPVPVIYRTGY